MSDFKQLRYFLTLAECLNYRKAARDLNITQPPLSRQIAALEASLGVKLFNRHPYGVSMTRAGEIFYTDVRAVVSSYEMACQNVCKMAAGEKGRLSLGFMMHAAYSTIPALTKHLITCYPDLQLSLQEVTPALLVDAVLAGKYDVGIVFNPGPVRFLEQMKIRSEKLCLAVWSSHPLAKERRVNATQLRNEPLIVTPHSVAPILRGMTDLYLHQQGVEPYYLLETQLQQTIINLVAEEVGIALVPETVKKLRNVGLVYVELDHSPVIEQVIIWHKDNSNPALNTFTELASTLLG